MSRVRPIGWGAAVMLAAACLAPAAPALAHGPRAGSSGMLTFSGYYSGRLRLPAYSTLVSPGCLWGTDFDALNGTAGVELFLGNVALKVDGKSETLHNLDLEFGFGRFGTTEALQRRDLYSTTEATVGLNDGIGGNVADIAFAASGTVTTNAAGTAGSVHATLVGEKDFAPVASQRFTVTGSWRGCGPGGPGSV